MMIKKKGTLQSNSERLQNGTIQTTCYRTRFNSYLPVQFGGVLLLLLEILRCHIGTVLQNGLRSL